jgi:hypothetical protein
MNATEWIFVLLSTICLGLITESIKKNRQIGNLLDIKNIDEQLFVEYDEWIKILNAEINTLEELLGETRIKLEISDAFLAAYKEKYGNDLR